jgi:hypothetical protein
MMEAALGLGAKCREVVTIDFGNVCHVLKLLRKLKNTTGDPHLLSLRRCPHDKIISIRCRSYALIYSFAAAGAAEKTKRGFRQTRTT